MSSSSSAFSFGSSRLSPVSLLRRGGRSLRRFPVRGLAAFVVLGLVMGLGPIAEAVLGLPGGGATLAERLRAGVEGVPVVPLDPQTGTLAGLGSLFERASLDLRPLLLAPPPESVIAHVAAILLAGPALAGAYAVVLPCTREGAGDAAAGGIGGATLATAVGAFLVSYAARVVGLVLLVLPGLALGLALAPLMAVVADRRCGPWEAVRATWRLTRGRWFEILGFYLTLLAIHLGGAVPLLVVDVTTGGPAPSPIMTGVLLLWTVGVGTWGLFARAHLYRDLEAAADRA
jgi:hypothetical protein